MIYPLRTYNELFLDNVGWGFHPNKNNEFQKSTNYHPELAAPLVADEKEAYKVGCSQSISGSCHLQEYTDFNINKSNLGQLGWAESPTLEFCWGRNPNLQKAISYASWKATRHIKGDLVPAFTLAEVLITLGIIGVVAAMTLPLLIQNYQKQVVITRLKYAYNVLSNVLKRAEADYGNITEWGLESSGYADYSTIDAVKLRENFVRQYMLPYISDAKFTTNNPLSYYGYKTEIKKAYGSMAYPLDTGAPMVLQFKNGMVIILNVGVATSPEDPDKLGVAGITFVIDVDGPSGKNIFGRDVYWAHIPFVTNTRFMFYRLYAIYANKVMSPIHVARASLIDECKNGGYYCAFLIHSDGWQIKDDYPHKF